MSEGRDRSSVGLKHFLAPPRAVHGNGPEYSHTGKVAGRSRVRNDWDVFSYYR